ncbi:MAG: diguanylate cyclase [Syntrophobacterales bacterium]|nr:diguanylate cyclase [Syntrophobacterales bacterium]
MNHNFPVLIAEDDPVSRILLKKILHKAGYEVTSVENGRKALDLFNDKSFPVILTDWMMPEIDGLELCRIIRNKAFEGYIYIILLTAKDSKDDIVKGLEAGADDYLTKPFNRAELLARLNTAIRILKLEESLKKANEEIRIISITDPLTGCYNRAFMTQCLSQEIQRARRYNHAFSLILCDIDKFKIINDTYGHQTGDKILEEFTQCIMMSIRNDIDMLFRYGGDEFLIALPETDIKGACTLAERLRESVSQKRITAQEKQIRITSSFGVTDFDPTTTDEEISSETLISRADKCLYKAKKEGRNMTRADKP